MYHYDNYWHKTANINGQTRQPISKDHSCDIVIIGAGFTGLWAAYYLKKLNPEYDIVILEAEYVGFGASGRNGGWVIPGISGLGRYLHKHDYSFRQQCCEVLTHNVIDMQNVIAKENIDCDFQMGGVMELAARYPSQLQVQKHQFEEMQTLGYNPDSYCWLEKQEVENRIQAANAFGALFNKIYATLHPGKLVQALAKKLESMDVLIFEKSPALSCREGFVQTKHAKIKTSITTLIATEAYNSNLRPMNKYIVPSQSLIIATTQLSKQQWDAVGMQHRFCFADASKVINYGHRTADGRIIFGARGGYRFGGKPMRDFKLSKQEILERKRILARLLPGLENVDIEFAWGGSLGLSRRFCPHVLIDKDLRIASCGGYGGEGVAASHLFAKTFAEIITNNQGDRTAMPWVYPDHKLDKVLQRWEPEPLRWIGAHAMFTLFRTQEYLERHNNRLSKLGSTPLSKLNDKLSSLVS